MPLQTAKWLAYGQWKYSWRSPLRGRSRALANVHGRERKILLKLADIDEPPFRVEIILVEHAGLAGKVTEELCCVLWRAVQLLRCLLHYIAHLRQSHVTRQMSWAGKDGIGINTVSPRAAGGFWINPYTVVRGDCCGNCRCICYRGRWRSAPSFPSPSCRCTGKNGHIGGVITRRNECTLGINFENPTTTDFVL